MDLIVTQILDIFFSRFPLQWDWQATFFRSWHGLIRPSIEYVLVTLLMSWVIAKLTKPNPLSPLVF